MFQFVCCLLSVSALLNQAVVVSGCGLMEDVDPAPAASDDPGSAEPSGWADVALGVPDAAQSAESDDECFAGFLGGCAQVAADIAANTAEASDGEAAP